MRAGGSEDGTHLRTCRWRVIAFGSLERPEEEAISHGVGRLGVEALTTCE